jgi:hypothetical protein
MFDTNFCDGIIQINNYDTSCIINFDGINTQEDFDNLHIGDQIHVSSVVLNTKENIQMIWDNVDLYFEKTDDLNHIIIHFQPIDQTKDIIFYTIDNSKVAPIEMGHFTPNSCLGGIDISYDNNGYPIVNILN